MAIKYLDENSEKKIVSWNSNHVFCDLKVQQTSQFVNKIREFRPQLVEFNFTTII